MKHLSRIVSDYFTFSKKQRMGVFFAFSIIVLCMIIRLGHTFFISAKAFPIDSTFLFQVAQLQQANADKGDIVNYQRYGQYRGDNNAEYSTYSSSHTLKGKLFEFDPNTLSAEGWKQLGLREKTIQTIQNYTAKGGKFRHPEDIRHIYGLFPDEAERLLPYIKIDNVEISDFNKYDKNQIQLNHTSTATSLSFDINTADTTAFISLPGIGPKLAYRIVSFREKLGGFYSIDQIREIYGLPDSVFQKIKSKLSLKNVSVKQININTSEITTLKTHPYLKWNIANAIIQYRAQHGNFISLEDLKKITVIDEQLFNKIVPYLTM